MPVWFGMVKVREGGFLLLLGGGGGGGGDVVEKRGGGCGGDYDVPIYLVVFKEGDGGVAVVG